jgi:RNA polymerase sigma-70 factor (ECF subfamily)
VTAGTSRDQERLAALRTRDPVLLAELVAELTPAMLRLAGAHTASRASAEDVVQEAWLTVLSSVDRFEGRSALRTWVLGIVLNKARRLAAKERRTVPLSASWWSQARERGAPAVDPDRFAAPGAAQAAGTWVRPPHRWDLLPEDELGVAELRAAFETALDALPARQRAVMTARDVLGLDAEEVGALYGLSEGNQRVLLHRARSRVRTAVEEFVSGSDPAPADPPLSRRRPVTADPAGPRTGGLRPGTRRRPPTPRPDAALVCQQLVEIVDEYLDGDLDPRLRARVEEHLAGCDGCSGYVAQVQRMLSVTATLADAAPPALLARLVSALRDGRESR